MKIAITFFTFGKDIFAGMENALYNFAKGLQINNCEVFIYTSKASGTETEIDGITVFRSEYLPTSFSSGDRKIIEMLAEKKAELQLEMKQFLDKYKPDILIAWDPLWGFIQYLDVYKFSPIPTYLSLHVISEKDVLQLSEEYPYINRFAVSKIFIQQLKDKGYTSSVDVLPNSINIKKVRSLANEAKPIGIKKIHFLQCSP